MRRKVDNCDEIVSIILNWNWYPFLLTNVLIVRYRLDQLNMYKFWKTYISIMSHSHCPLCCFSTTLIIYVVIIKDHLSYLLNFWVYFILVRSSSVTISCLFLSRLWPFGVFLGLELPLELFSFLSLLFCLPEYWSLNLKLFCFWLLFDKNHIKH